MTLPTESRTWLPPSSPIGPSKGLRYGGFWVRTLAYVVDALILGLGGWVISSATGVDMVTAQTQAFRTDTFGSVSVVVSPILPGFLLYLVYFCGLWVVRGQTIGMMPFGLKVVRASDGRRIGPGRAVGRFVGLILSFVVLLIGVIWVAADSRKQGWHDKLARTVVVRPAPAPTLPAQAAAGP